MTNTTTTGSYDPLTYQPLTFHDAAAAFSDGSDTPRAYLERCLETVEAREPTLKAFAARNDEGARAAADASTARYQAGHPALIYRRDADWYQGSSRNP